MKAYPSIIPIRLGRSSSSVDPHHRVSRAPAGGWPPVEILKFQISNLKFSFRRFSDSDSNSTPSTLPAEGGAKRGPPALRVAFQSKILNFKSEILFPEICRLRPQLNPIHPSRRRRGEEWVTRPHKRRREPNGSRLPSFNYLLLAPVAGGTTVGGIATCYVRRLHRSCKAERDYCHQHHCPDLLHGFSPWEYQMWFLSTVGQCHRRSTRANVGE
jgi:hypothetical protein